MKKIIIYFLISVFIILTLALPQKTPPSVFPTNIPKPPPVNVKCPDGSTCPT
ncbi:14401_t:CDS:1, partial [Gigaspora rosea]